MKRKKRVLPYIGIIDGNCVGAEYKYILYDAKKQRIWAQYTVLNDVCWGIRHLRLFYSKYSKYALSVYRWANGNWEYYQC